MAELEHTLMGAHTKPKEDHLPPDLLASLFVFNPPLQPKYDGPFQVLKC